PSDSPVHVLIDTDPSKSFYVGPYDRTRIDLVEQFHPLQTASVARGDQLRELRRKAAGVRSFTKDPVLVDASPIASEIDMQDGNTVITGSSPSPR
ncbi:hypothetical protein GCK32_019504, partial [Trichostrongylus colubriformis]